MTLYCKNIVHLSVDYYSGSLELFDEEKVASHLRDCDSCRKNFEYIQCGMTAMDALKPVQTDPYLWDDIEISLQEDVRSRAMKRQYKIRQYKAQIRKLAAVFAVLLIIIGLYVSIQEMVFNPNDDIKPAGVYVTDRGERKEIQLAGLAYIQLNYDSHLQIDHKNDADKLIMNLSGEAFFRIDTDEIPVRIVTSSGIVNVHGTSFGTRARGNGVVVAVEKGAVSLMNGVKNKEASQLVIPEGSVGIISPDRTTPFIADSDVTNHLEWRYNKFVFDQSPISEVIAELERAYNVIIRLDMPEPEVVFLTASFHRDPLDIILEEIALATSSKVYKEDSNYIIRSFMNESD